jgi:hypothetical protein
MNCEPSFRRRDGGIAVLDADSSRFGWVSGDLSELLGTPSLDEVPDARRGAAPAKPTPDLRPEPQRRVPDRDIIYVGPRLDRPADEPLDLAEVAVRRLRSMPLLGVTGRSPVRGSLIRPLLALLVVELTVLGAIHVSRRYTSPQVIVAPAPSSDRSVIT